MIIHSAVTGWLRRTAGAVTVGVAAWAVAITPVSAQEMGKAPAGASVKIASPDNGATVKSPVKVTMTVHGMAIAPAGALKDGTGHHHLIVDTIPPGAGVAVPADAQNLHFGKGQTEADLTLAPGIHTITAAFADGVHRVYGPQMTDTIIIKVE